MSENNAVAVIVKDDFKAVEVLGEQPGALAELLRENVGTEMSAFDLPRIKVPSGGGQFWAYQTAAGPVSTPTIEGVIVLKKQGKSYWAVSYDDATETTPPDCHSDDCITGIGTPGGACSQCPLNKYESAAKGDGKACKDQVDIAIITRDGIIPTVIQVPPTSLKSLKQYGIMMMGSGKSIHDVVTRFSLHVEKKQGKDTAIIDFSSAGLVPDEMKRFIRAYKADVAALYESSKRKPEQDVTPEYDSRPMEDGDAPQFS